MRYLILSLLIVVSLSGKRLHYESYYQDKWCGSVNGVTEVTLEDGSRVDCVTDKKAVEVDFANKWAECIGQALHYGIMLNKKPVCLLIMEDPIGDIRYLERLKNVSERYCIEIQTITP